MACFVAPLVEGAVVSITKNIIKMTTKDTIEASEKTLSLTKSLSVLENMLYGGSFLLALEHIYHGEVILVPPFFTKIIDGNLKEMLQEIGTTGVAMAALVTSVWGIGSLIYKAIKKGEANPSCQN